MSKSAIEVVVVFKWEPSEEVADTPGSGDAALNELWGLVDKAVDLGNSWECYQRQLTVKVDGKVDQRFDYKRPPGF